ncbi:hypothetical protein FGM00_01650 [Aggregatimonas sangjinii]|uniref:Uncharacterized protein n=1 Tax=Aggregatimonas sangjinii TaxID=2583587 RepID=A0A5B7SPD7_9FLAO|nr:hypothetical protein [Aggregatimonas sangjinii]QCW98887.1 hypothetical protein FGM00_01650 [Aggregatimonas sangjinii]
MKKTTTFILLCLMTYCAVCTGQTEHKTNKKQTIAKSKKEDTLEQLNLLDEQTKIYGQLFELAGSGEENPLGGATNYLELLEKIDLPAEQKELLYEQYKIYDLSLDPTKKDSLRIMFDKMMTRAIEKSKNDH